MKRRDFLKYGAAGAVGASMAASGAAAQTACTTATTTGPVSRTFELTITDYVQEMVDGTPVRMLAFQDRRQSKPQAPGPVLRAQANERVKFVIFNQRPEAHSFEITGLVCPVTIPAGSKSAPSRVEVTLQLSDRQNGTYIYHDNTGKGLFRVLGLGGVFIVQPDYTTMGVADPYGPNQSTPAVRSVFAALANGLQGRFRPGPWVPAKVTDSLTTFPNQEKVWTISQVDPSLHALITDGPIVVPAGDVRDRFVPRYFTMNGRSGFDLTEGADVVVKNYIGEPALLRVVNIGLAHHANHIHGNHLLEIAEAELLEETTADYVRPVNSGRVIVNRSVLEYDVWNMWPMQRRDLILPLEVPPDIPYSPVNQFENMAANPITIDDPAGREGRREPFPLRYVMHCHCEMSQTAAGGNYPQGLVTHWEIEGGYGGRARSTATRTASL